MEPLLYELERVEKTYGHGGHVVRALAGVDLRIAQGEFVAIMGTSGSGKSTCMNVLGCLDVPTAGRFRFMGVDATDLGVEQRARLRRHYLGFVFQGFNLLPRMSARENVELPLVYRGVPAPERRERAMRALADVGLRGRESHAPNQLSGGQQQRVAIARAIVADPLVVLADEPTGNLDSAHKRDVMDLLATLHRDRRVAVVMVTHEPEMAEWAERVVVFRDGAIAADTRREAAA